MVNRELRIPEVLARRLTVAAAATGLSGNAFTLAALDAAITALAENDESLSAVINGVVRCGFREFPSKVPA